MKSSVGQLIPWKAGARQAGASVKVNLYPEDEAVTELERLAQDLADALADN